MKKIICLTVFLAVLYYQEAQAQDASNGISVSVIHGPAVFSPTATPLRGGFSTVECAYLLSMGNNSSDWVRALHVADIKIAATYSNMDNVLLQGMHGSTYAIGPSGGIVGSLDIPLLQTGKTTFLVSPGFGVNYFTQDFYTNYQPVVGSHNNFVEQLSAQVQYAVSESTRFGFGIHIRHISNGEGSMPNVGLNPIGVLFSVTHDINTQGPEFPRITYEDKMDDIHHHLEVSIVYGEHGPVQTGYYKFNGQGYYVVDTVKQRTSAASLPHIGISAAYDYNINSVFSLKAGTDIVYYDQTFSSDNLTDFLRTYEDQFTSYAHISLGTSVGGSVWLGTLSINGSFGYYVYYKSYYKKPTYWIVGANYNMTSWLALGVKMHMQGRDPNFIGVGITTSFL